MTFLTVGIGLVAIIIGLIYYKYHFVSIQMMLFLLYCPGMVVAYIGSLYNLGGLSVTQINLLTRIL